MTNKVLKDLFLFLSGLILAAATALSVPAQYPPGVKQKLADGAEQTLSGVIRIPKEFGVVPNRPGLHEAAPLPCNPFWVAVLDPNHQACSLGSRQALSPEIISRTRKFRRFSVLSRRPR